MDDEEWIVDLLQPYGVVIQPADLDDVVASGLREQLDLYRTVSQGYGCAFLGNMDFNAVATTNHDRYAVGINIGAAVLIARYAYCLMSDPTMLPDIGDPHVETVDPDVIEALRSPGKEMDYGRYLPRDPTRREAAKQISLAAYLVLFLHEINHIELGHLDFARANQGASEYREITAVPFSTGDCAVLRALELEADLAALQRSLRVWRVLFPRFDKSALTALTPDASWLLATELLYWIMDFLQPDIRHGPHATHPSPIARLVNAQELASAAPWTSTTDDDPGHMVPWIIRNKFSSRAIGDPHYLDSDRVECEIRDTFRKLVEILPDLERHRHLAHRE